MCRSVPPPTIQNKEEKQDNKSKIRYHIVYFAFVYTIRYPKFCILHSAFCIVKQKTPLSGSFVVLLKCLFDVFYKVVNILDTYRETDKVGVYSCFSELFLGELTVGMACRVEKAGL